MQIYKDILLKFSIIGSITSLLLHHRKNYYSLKIRLEIGYINGNIIN